MDKSFAKVNSHPCFNKAANRWFDCVYLPVALRCNMKCNYCNKLEDCPNEHYSGVASLMLTPGDALKKVGKLVKDNSRLKTVCIAGPGESLANKETFKTLELINRSFPDLIKCISTNGLLLAEKIDELVEVGVNAVSITVNTMRIETGKNLSRWLHYHGEEYYGEAGASLLLESQLSGIQAAVTNGMAVKLNTVLIPGFNDFEITSIAMTAKRLGVTVMNVTPLVPKAEFSLLQSPTEEELSEARYISGQILGHFNDCKKCSTYTQRILQ